MSYGKIIVIGFVLFGIYFGFSALQARQDHKAFSQEVREAVEYNWRPNNAKEVIENIIREKAEQRGIELGPDDVVVKYSKSIVSETPYNQTYYVLVSAVVSYDRKVTPFYTAQLKICAANRMGRG